MSTQVKEKVAKEKSFSCRLRQNWLMVTTRHVEFKQSDLTNLLD